MGEHANGPINAHGAPHRLPVLTDPVIDRELHFVTKMRFQCSTVIVVGNTLSKVARIRLVNRRLECNQSRFNFNVSPPVDLSLRARSVDRPLCAARRCGS